MRCWKNLDMDIRNSILLVTLAALTFLGCAKSKIQHPLPILGNYEVRGGDTIYHRIPDFSFVDQDSTVITNKTFAGKVYVADFFFTSCPSICPKVKKEELRMYGKYKSDPRIEFLSHSIDTKRDTVGRLKMYASNLGVNSAFWHFVTGKKEDIFKIANDYFVSALEDPGAPGGFDHSGRLILVDKDRHIRAFCNGTVPEEVDAFMDQIDQLLATEYFSSWLVSSCCAMDAGTLIHKVNRCTPLIVSTVILKMALVLPNSSLPSPTLISSFDIATRCPV